jgi:hypothetical protein
VGFVPKDIHVAGSTSYGETKIGPCPMKNHSCFFEKVRWLIDKHPGECKMAFRTYAVDFVKVLFEDNVKIHEVE